ncbi:MAG: hypothetical protein HKN18_03120 [Silicimonas sp.]|nr:hypothetical protein [Silicimonas sp.]
MTPIFDTALLKHHRMDYGPAINANGLRRSGKSVRNLAIVIVALVGLNIVAGAFGLPV